MKRNRKWFGLGASALLVAVVASAALAQALWSDEVSRPVPTQGGYVTQNFGITYGSSSPRTFNVYKADGVTGPDTVYVPGNSSSVNLTVCLPSGNPGDETCFTLTETNTSGRELINHDVLCDYSY